MSRFKYRRTYRRNLPHIQPPGATFFVTFRLDGSLPQSVIKQWKQEREWLADLKRKNASSYCQAQREFERAWFAKFEFLLDGANAGPVWLNDPRVASLLAESLHYRHGRVYRLDAFTIMSNHVHLIMKPLPTGQVEIGAVDETSDSQLENVEYHSLASIMHSLKGYTAFEAN